MTVGVAVPWPVSSVISQVPETLTSCAKACGDINAPMPNRSAATRPHGPGCSPIRIPILRRSNFARECPRSYHRRAIDPRQMHLRRFASRTPRSAGAAMTTSAVRKPDVVHDSRRQVAEHDLVPVLVSADHRLDHVGYGGDARAFGGPARHHPGRLAHQDVLVKAADPSGTEHGFEDLEDLAHHLRREIRERKARDYKVVVRPALDRFDGPGVNPNPGLDAGKRLIGLDPLA